MLPALHKFAFPLHLRALGCPMVIRPGCTCTSGIRRQPMNSPKPPRAFSPAPFPSAGISRPAGSSGLGEQFRVPAHQAPRSSVQIRITGASQKRRPNLPRFSRHLLPQFSQYSTLFSAVFRNFFRHVLNEIAFRDTASIPGKIRCRLIRSSNSPCPHFFALFPRRNPGLVRKSSRRRPCPRSTTNFFPELFHRLPPRQLAFFNLVQLFFQPRR